MNTEFNIEDYNGNNSINTLRGTIWLNGRFKILKERLILTHESYFQPSLRSTNNFRWQTDISLEIPITNKFNFKVNYLDTYESIVVKYQLQYDRLLTFGFTIKSY